MHAAAVGLSLNSSEVAEVINAVAARFNESNTQQVARKVRTGINPNHIVSHGTANDLLSVKQQLDIDKMGKQEDEWCESLSPRLQEDRHARMKVHQVWIGAPPPAQKERWMLSVKNMARLLQLEYVRWGNANITRENFPLTHHVLQAMQLPGSNAPMAMICDVMRMEIVLHHGGMYFDANFQVLNPAALAAVVGHIQQGRLVTCNAHGPTNRYLSNSFFAAPPGHGALQKVVDRFKTLQSADFTRPANVVTGPYPWGDVVYRTESWRVVKLPSRVIFPVFGSSDISIDKCYRKNKWLGDAECAAQYPTSWTIDHYALGATWRKTPSHALPTMGHRAGGAVGTAQSRVATQCSTPHSKGSPSSCGK